MKYLLITQLLLITVFSNLEGQEKAKHSDIIFNDSISRAVHQIIEKHAQVSMQDPVIDALSIGIHYNGVSFMEHYGTLELGKLHKPSHKTIYEIASVTKTFTGTLAAQAVLEGKLSLEEPIDKYLPKSYDYSNFGTNLMAYILEKVYQKPFQELVTEEVIEKAHMQETKFHLFSKDKKYLAIGYERTGLPMPPLSLANTLWGAEGALKSTLPDMMKYISYQMNHQNPIVKEAHRKIYEIDNNYWIGYFWWTIHNMDQDLHYRHDGGALGTRNVLLIYPEAKIGISIFTNKATEGVFENLSKLAKAIYKDLK